MELKPSSASADAHAVPVYVVQPAETGGAGLTDILSLIAKHRMLILMCMAISVLLAVGFNWFQKPAYRAESILQPPEQHQIQELLVYYGDGKESAIKWITTTDSVFKRFLRQLRSRGEQQKFLKGINSEIESGSPASKTAEGDGRSRDLVYDMGLRVDVSVKDPSLVTVSAQHTDPEFVAKILNRYIDVTNSRVVEQLKKDAMASVQFEIRRLENRMLAKLDLAGARKQDHITRLKEALRVARALGVDKEHSSFKVLDGSGKSVAVNTVAVPLYMRGITALEEEISVLEDRKFDEAFTPGYRELQERLSLLRQISIDSSLVSSVNVDTVASKPARTDGSKSVRRFILAIVLGTLAGVFLVFVVEFFRSSRESAQEVSP